VHEHDIALVKAELNDTCAKRAANWLMSVAMEART